MKHARVIVAALVALAIVGGLSADATAKKKPVPMFTYLIETSHDAAQCLTNMDSIAKNKKMKSFLEGSWWGCESGDHRIWTKVRAATPEDAIAKLPEELRGTAKAVQVKQYTAQDLKKLKKKIEKDAAGGAAGAPGKM